MLRPPAASIFRRFLGLGVAALLLVEPFGCDAIVVGHVAGSGQGGEGGAGATLATTTTTTTTGGGSPLTSSSVTTGGGASATSTSTGGGSCPPGVFTVAELPFGCAPYDVEVDGTSVYWSDASETRADGTA